MKSKRKNESNYRHKKKYKKKHKRNKISKMWLSNKNKWMKNINKSI